MGYGLTTATKAFGIPHLSYLLYEFQADVVPRELGSSASGTYIGAAIKPSTYPAREVRDQDASPSCSGSRSVFQSMAPRLPKASCSRCHIKAEQKKASRSLLPVPGPRYACPGVSSEMHVWMLFADIAVNVVEWSGVETVVKKVKE